MRLISARSEVRVLLSPPSTLAIGFESKKPARSESFLPRQQLYQKPRIDEVNSPRLRAKLEDGMYLDNCIRKKKRYSRQKRSKEKQNLQVYEEWVSESWGKEGFNSIVSGYRRKERAKITPRSLGRGIVLGQVTKSTG